MTAVWPVPWWLAGRLARTPEAVCGVLPLALAAAFLWRDRAPRRIDPGAGVLAVLVAAYALTWVVPCRTAGAALAMIAVAHAVTARGVARQRGSFPAIVGLLLLALPVVRDLELYAGFPLRVATGEVASRLLAAAGCSVERAGTGLLWSGRVVEIDAPCSGVRMLWTGAVVVCAGAAWMRLRTRRLAMLAAAGLMLVLAGNALRTAVLFFIETGMLRAPAWMHEAVGVLVFMGVAASVLEVARRWRGP